jgi:hypothetical protein
MAIFDEKVLILCKTYPSPSEKYVETSCVAGVRPNGSLIRLYPVPFRLVAADKQFKKWQWIEAKIEKARKDHRPESHQIKIDTLKCSDTVLPTAGGWRDRRLALAQTPIAHSFAEVEAERERTGQSLALMRPSKLIELEIEEVRPSSWTDDEIAKLAVEQKQGSLFDDDQADVRTLKKLPYSFYYRYECKNEFGNSDIFRHKLVDWEIGALYWNCVSRYGRHWEPKFREKIWDFMLTRDMIFLMGNIHRFPSQGLIVSIIYLPKRNQIQQPDLFG